jgi:hypothetical protein
MAVRTIPAAIEIPVASQKPMCTGTEAPLRLGVSGRRSHGHGDALAGAGPPGTATSEALTESESPQPTRLVPIWLCHNRLKLPSSKRTIAVQSPAGPLSR